MNTCTFKSVLDETILFTGRDPSTASLSQADKDKIVALINQRAREGWMHADWPELTFVEERPFRASWSSEVAYAVDDEIYQPTDDTYYKCIQAHTNQEPPAALYWEEITALETYLPWSPLDLYPLGTVYRVTKEHPYRYPDRVYTYCHQVTMDGVWVAGSDGSAPGTKVYVEYRMLPPVFTATPFSEATTYAIGAIVYQEAQQECFQRVLVGGAATWNKIDFPEFLKAFVTHAAAADWLRWHQMPAVDQHLAMAYDALKREAIYAREQQAQMTGARVTI